MEETSTSTVAGQTEAAAQDVAADVKETMNTVSVETTQGSDGGETGMAPLEYGAIAIAAIILITIIAMIFRRRGSSKGGAKSGASGSGNDIVEIYVGNLSYDMTDAQLRKEFERYGVVKSARVITHRTNGKSKGYGFVEMPHRKEATIAIKALDTSEIMGRRLRVNEARANTRPPEK